MKKIFIQLLLLFSSAISAFAGQWQAPGAELLPGSQVFPYPISQARWLWFQAKEIKGSATAYYRLTLDLEDDVKDAWFYLIMDDKGKIKVNGKTPRYSYPPQSSSFQIKIPRYNLSKDLKKGKNIISFEVFNNVNTGGLFFNGEITLVNGKKLPLISDKKVKAAPQAKGNWESIDFDDSSWQSAWEFGDALTHPWNTACNIIEFGMSEKEKKVYRAAFDNATKIPSSIASEPIRKTVLDFSRMVPAIKVGDTVIPPALHKPGNTFMPERADITMKFAKTGIKWLELGVLDYDVIREDGFDFSVIDSDIRRVLNLAPDTFIGVCIRFSQRNYLWMKNNPDELIKYPTGEADQNNDTLRRKAPSMASEKYHKEMNRIIKAFFDWAKKQPWYSRIISCRIANGCYLEWHYYGMRRDMPDVSMPMIKAFRKYLTLKYKNDAALQKAWKNSNVTLATATVPGVAERTGKGNFLRDPATGSDCQTMDYYGCLQNVIADTLLNCAKSVKESAPHLLVGAYYGYVLQMNFPPEGQTILLDKVIGSPYIDFLSAPICYDHSRSPESDGLKRTLPSVFARHKKLHIVEQDTRTHITYPKIYSPAHSAELFARDSASALLDGCGSQFLSIHGVYQRHWMNSPEILSAIHNSLELWKELYALPAKAKESEKIAVVFNTPEMYLHGYPTIEKQKQPIMQLTTEPVHALIRSGYTFDLLDLPGFLNSANDYKVVIFLNTFTIDAETAAAIKEKVRKAGVTAIWHYAPGAVATNGWSESSASDLTGMGLKLIPGGTVTIKGIPVKTELALSPRMAVNDSKAEKALPYAKSPEYTAMAQKKLPSGATAIFCGAPITDPATWSKLLSEAGLKPFTTPGNVMLGFGKRILIPVSKRKSIQVKLPQNAKKITELVSYKNIPAGKAEFTLQSSGPAVYLIEW
ncbi:MAG: beta-galactosidase [Lentisphaeria bacterium]|nr:beta-galactosidase [Lentisphaeria bacterium]